tara:strand:- start:87 stop:833 length:747 start_codon:yes stop_codon:yes gene_type:complete
MYISANSNKIKKIYHKKTKLKFYIPNKLNIYRASSFATKEPETLEWIDNFEKDSILWDIGSNIGLYSCYAAKTKCKKVFAFEPSFFNLELLSKNIYLNRLSDKIIVIPTPLTNKQNIEKFNMTSTELGGAISTFGSNISFNGKLFSPTFYYQTIGNTLNNLSTNYKLQNPDYIKIDVDGVEHLILEGSTNIISNVKSMLIEVNTDFKEQFNYVNNFMQNNNFSLDQKYLNKLNINQSSYNQIWIRNYE